MRPRRPREDDPRHVSARRSQAREFCSHVVERRDLASLYLLKPLNDVLDRTGIRQDLRCLFQGLVLVDGHEHRRRVTIARHDHVLAAVGDFVEVFSQARAKLAGRYGARHKEKRTQSVYASSYTSVTNRDSWCATSRTVPIVCG